MYINVFHYEVVIILMMVHFVATRVEELKYLHVHVHINIILVQIHIESIMLSIKNRYIFYKHYTSITQ